MDEVVGNEGKSGSNGVGGFGLALLGATISCVVGMTIVIGLTLAARGLSEALPAFCLAALFVWLLVACVNAGRRRVWSRFWGLVAGALLGMALVVAWICHELSHMRIGGF